MRVLLTGARGFVGSYFLQKYNNSYEIRTFSFLRDKRENLSLCDIDVVVHLSALVHQMGGADEEEYYRINVEQTLALAKQAKREGVKHFVFMSSIKVCGEESEKVYDQHTKCLPQDGYGKSKREAEKQLLALEDEYFCVSIIRTPIVYGYGVKANIANLVHLVEKVPFLPFGDIENKRSMIYVGNLCFIIDTIVRKRIQGVFFVADDELLSTKEFIYAIAQALSKTIMLPHIFGFAFVLKHLKPSFYKRLYGSLKVDNTAMKQKLFGSCDVPLPYTVEEGIYCMIHGEQ